MIRFFDIIFAFLGLLLFFPFFLIFALIIVLDSKGGVFYCQQRVGKGNKPFLLYKFRSMRSGSDKEGLLTVGNKDSRITPVGSFLRKTKLDEWPQLFNVLKGEMSIVGPRPEVLKYTALYTKEQQKILNVRPGITDLASILFRNENELLAKQKDPEQYYIEHITPRKIRMNMAFIENPSLGNYFSIIFKTLHKIIRK